MRVLALLSLLACKAPTGEKADNSSLDPLAADDDGDGWAAGEDCNDHDAATHDGAVEVCDGIDNNCDGAVDEGVSQTWYPDEDGDGFGDLDAAVEACSPEAGQVANGTDCDDAAAAIFPGAPEACDGLDNNCDGAIDEGEGSPWYADADLDGFGDPETEVVACAAPAGFVEDDQDCDDESEVSFPGAPELCDELDNDCDGTVDEGVSSTFYEDRDTDGYGTLDATVEACAEPAGYATLAGDCDDDDAAYNPGAFELDCTDPNDYNCDGSVGYADADHDGWAACVECDDSDPSVRPDGVEVCGGADEDCDGLIDDADPSVDPASTAAWYPDGDGDHFGDPASPRMACAAAAGEVADGSDCDDGRASVWPGAPEVCDSLDDDCDGLVDDADPDLVLSTASAWYGDGDGDGHGDPAAMTVSCLPGAGSVALGDDCDDTAGAVFPGAVEVCNGLDDDCDLLADDADPGLDLSTATAWYVDLDGDGFGDPATVSVTCEPGVAEVADATDCDDGDGAVFPGAVEVCDGIDNNCDRLVDDDDPALDLGTATESWADADGDGYGDPAVSTLTCRVPSGYTLTLSDCDDSEPLAFPGGVEVCDGVDNDCSGAADEAVCLDISNVDPGLLELGTTSLTISTSTTINTSTGAITGVRGAGTGLVDGIWFEVYTPASGLVLGVFAADGLTIRSGATLSVTGSNGLVILSAGDATIAGSLSAAGADGTQVLSTSGPTAGASGLGGGGSGGAGSTRDAAGFTAGSGVSGGGVPVGGIHYGNGGGGGGGCYGGGGGMGDRPSVAGSPGTASAGGAGGYGGGDGGRGGTGGAPYGTATLEPLVAGSGGAGGVADTDRNPDGAGGPGGAGGGAIQLSVDGLLTVTGTISTKGGIGGDAWGGAGGGGSGGGLLLEALDLTVSGTLNAAGGRGGHGNLAWSPASTTGGTAGGLSSLGGGGGQTESGGGGGGSGRLYLRYLNSLSATGTTRPALGTACAGSAPM